MTNKICARLTAIAILFFAQTCVAQEPTDEMPIGFSTIDQAYDALVADENATRTDYEGWIIFNQKVNGKYILWSFTPSEHNADPAVVRREIVSKDGKLNINMSALCYAAKSECDELIAQFKKINANLRKKHDQGS